MKRKRKKKKRTQSRNRRGKGRAGLWIGIAAGALLVAGGVGFVMMRPEARVVASGPPNVLLITIDAIRADHVGCYGADAVRTPTIDRVAGVGTTYAQCFAPAPRSRVSHASIHTGLYPFYHGVRGGVDAGLHDDAVTLAELLKDAGYATGAFVASGALHPRYGLAQGFDTYDGDLSYASITGRTQFGERGAQAVTDAALNWLMETSRNQRTFLWVHYTDPQYPYAPPGYRPGGAGGANPYDLEISYVDAQIERLLGMIEDREASTGRVTLLVIAGTCGEALFDHGESTHGLLLYNETLHVPLIVSGAAKLVPGTKVGQLVSLVDVMPSVLDWLDIEPPRRFNGRVLPAESGLDDVPLYFETRYPFVEYGWAPLTGIRVGSKKLIMGPQPEYYDLLSDAKEQRNRYVNDLSEAEKLQRVLDQFKSSALGYPRIGPLAVEPEASDPAFVAAGNTSPDDPRPNPKDRITLHRLRLDARAQLGDGKPEQAIATLRNLLEKDPGNRRALEMLLRLSDNDSVRSQALDALRQRAFAGDDWEKPFDLLIHRKLGMASLDAGQAREAGRLLNIAIAADPNDSLSHFHLARAMEQADLGDPVPHYQRAAELNPKNAEYALAAADRLELAGRYKDATAIYHHALQEAPDNPDLLAASSWTLYKSAGDKELALSRARRAVDQRPGEVKYQHALAVATMWNGNNEEAATLLDEAVAADMDYAVTRLRKYEAEGEYELLATLYDLLLDDHPDHPGLLNNSAWSDYELKRRPDRAMDRAERAVKLAPNVPPFRVTLAAILLWQNQPADAVTHLRHAVKVNSGYASAHYYLGLALRATGDNPGAIASLQQAIDEASDEKPPEWLEDARKQLTELRAGA